MHVPAGLDPVGRWYFKVSPEPSDGGSLRLRMSTALSAAAAVLAAADLLVAEKVESSHWLRRMPDRPVRTAVPPYHGAAPAALDRLGEALEAHAAQAGKPDAFPSSLTAHGYGIVRLPGGRQRQQIDLCEVAADYDADDVVIALETRSDIWLDHNLNADPQPDIAACNRPRLAAVLYRLAYEFGTTPQPSPSATKYALVHPYGVDSKYDVDGDPVATADWPDGFS